MTLQASNPLEAFQWTPQPQAERLVREVVEDFLRRCPLAAAMRDRFYAEAGVRFGDMVDSLDLGGLPAAEFEDAGDRFRAAGWVDERPPADGSRLLTQDKGMFPRVVLYDDRPVPGLEFKPPRRIGITLRVESVADFVSVWQTRRDYLVFTSPPTQPVRVMELETGDQSVRLSVVERHGCRYNPPPQELPDAGKLLRHAESFRMRPRRCRLEGDAGELEAVVIAMTLIDVAIADLGVGIACDLFFAAERDYWQRRNRAAQIQKARQDRVGIGWANHDHHTYRSSRRHFARLVSIFEKLGFHCRERFYAGRQAGWGAQVLEQPNAGVVIFADVDLSPDEVLIDFAHEPLPERDTLGTVGLWCALHGESFLQAGMHHLECQFDFDALRDQLETSAGVRMMKPFTDFPYLRQAFTEGERWPVDPGRVDALLTRGLITAQQAVKFRAEGAIGSHLENLERNQGFKGFNQTGVSEIIAATDPRKHLTG